MTHKVVGVVTCAVMLGVLGMAGCSSPGRGPESQAGMSVPTTSAPSSATTVSPTAMPVVVEDIDRVVLFNAVDGYGLFSEMRGSACSLAVAATKDGGHGFASPVQVTAVACESGSPAASLAFDDFGDGFVYGPQLFASHDHGATWAALPGFSNVLSVIPRGRSVWLLEDSCSQTSGTCTVGAEVSGDGGRSWSPVVLPGHEVTNGGIPAMVRTSDSATLIVMPPLAVSSDSSPPTSSPTLITADGGRTWKQDSAPCVGQSNFLSQAPDGTIWLACASEPGAGNQAKELARSFDGGISWTPVRCPATTSPWSGSGCYFSDSMNGGYLGDIVGTSSTTAFLAGGRNNVFVTRDGGHTWSQTNPPIGDMDSGTGSLFFADPTNGWVISGATTSSPQGLWRTNDGGSTWSEVWTASVPWTSPTGQTVSPCGSSQLTVSEASGGAGLGHSAVIILFKNTSATTCTLSGYPGVAGLDSAGHQVTQAVRTPSGYLGGLLPTNSTPPDVTLTPGQTASAKVEGTDNPAGNQTTCPTLSGLLATAPNTYTSVRLGLAPGDCSGLEVHPVVPGETGNQQN